MYNIHTIHICTYVTYILAGQETQRQKACKLQQMGINKLKISYICRFIIIIQYRERYVSYVTYVELRGISPAAKKKHGLSHSRLSNFRLHMLLRLSH